MDPKHKPRKGKPTSKRQNLTGPPPVTSPSGHSQRKCKKELIFRDDDDDTPIAKLVQKASLPLTPKTPKRHEAVTSDPSPTSSIPLPGPDPLKDSPQHRPKKHHQRSKRIKIHTQPDQATLPKTQATQDALTSPQFTDFVAMSQENTPYSMQVKIVHYWSTTISPAETSLSGFAYAGFYP